jgi:hypothetical protein
MGMLLIFPYPTSIVTNIQFNGPSHAPCGLISIEMAEIIVDSSSLTQPLLL